MFSQKTVSAGKEFNFVNYNSENGLDFVNTFKVFEDSKGYLWICTKDGLGRFNGIDFDNYSSKNGLPSSIVTDACEDKNGNIWFATIKGFAVFKNNKFDTALNLPKARILGMCLDKDGTIWAAVEKGLMHVDPTKQQKPLIDMFQNGETGPSASLRNVWLNKKGQVMAGNDSGCYVLKGRSMVRYIDVRKPIWAMLEFDDGTEWFTGWDQPLRVYKNGKLEQTIELGSAALDMMRDSKGTVWLATWDKGLFKYNGKDFINYSIKEGLPFNSFWGIDEDSHGNIWLSSWGRGIFRYSGEKFTRLSEKFGLPSNNITGIVETSDKKIWISSEQSITSYNPSSAELSNFTQYKGKNLSLIISLFTPDEKEVWGLGYIGKGYKVSNNNLQEDESLVGFGAFKDRRGNIFIGTDHEGIVKINQKNERTSIKTKEIHGTDRVMGFWEDPKENIWIFNEEVGVSLMASDGTLKNFRRKNGFVNELVTSVAYDSKGFYWFSVPSKGVYKCSLSKDLEIKIVDSLCNANGLRSENVNSLIIYNGILYLGTKYGLGVMPLYTESKKINYLNKEDGLLDTDCRLAFFDSKGLLWLNTAKGLYCYDPSVGAHNLIETKTQIKDIKLFFETADWSPYSKNSDEHQLPLDLKLPYLKNHLTFEFIGIDLSAPLKVLYQYKLEGLDQEWSPAVDKREATYSSIPPGTYTFMVKSCNSSGLWNKEPQTFVFTITPPFWRSLWFYACCVIFVLLIVYVYIKYREKQLQKEKLVLENKVEDRTKQLKEAFLQIEEKNKEITDSINYASKIQAALLPSHQDIEAFAKNCFVFFRPKDIVSGDFYWAERVGDNRFYLALCDSTGHGVPGAFMSLLNINFINEAVNEKSIEEPNEIFNYVRNELINSISKEGQRDGFDGVLLSIDRSQKKISYAAANSRPILVRDNVIVNLNSDKMPVGKGERQEPFKLFELDYLTGDVIYLYSDGFADQFGGIKGKKFKYKQLEELLNTIHTEDFNLQKELIEKKFIEWKGSLEQVDDVCVIGLKL